MTSTEAADRVLRLAMRIGDAQLLAGMSASDAVALIIRVARAYGLHGVQVDVTYTSIALSYHPGPHVPPLTYLHMVRRDIVDYTRVRNLDALVDDIAAGLPVDRAVVAFEWIVGTPHRAPGWLRTAATAGVAASTSLLFTTSWRILLTTFLVGCLVDRVLLAFRRRAVPPFFQQFAAAALITLLAAVMTYAGTRGVPFFAGLDATLIVVGGIIMLVAGMMIVGAVQDAIDQFYVTASARVFEVVMRTSGIVVGIVAALRLTQEVGVPMAIDLAPTARGHVFVQLAGATLIAACFSLWANADLVMLAISASTGLIGWLTYVSLLGTSAGEVLSRSVGAVAASLVASIAVARTDLPAFGVLSAALPPLVPGLTLYNGLLLTVGTSPGTGDPLVGLTTLTQALEVALGIAAGISLGTFLARPIAKRLRANRRHR